MSGGPETLDQSDVTTGAGAGPPAVPGLVLVFAGGVPVTVPVPLENGEVVLGRDHPVFAAHPDARMSRSHALVRFDGQRFAVTDLASRNGTSADGVPLAPRTPKEASRTIRVGDSLLVPVRDLGPIQRVGVRRAGGRVEGPALRAAIDAVAQAARVGTILHITGESGAGKEGLARAFHAGGASASGPFQAVNCAAIPEGVAERLLFGAKRGAFSGADADADGYVQAAHKGTLFLDEVAELGLPVQAKLLRVLETGEVLQLGASRPRALDLRFCSATHRDLRAEVVAGRLREDLYFRIAMPCVATPPLRERPEEIAWLVEQEVRRVAPGIPLHVSLVETCLLRVWPGNVRELLAEVRSAAQAACGARVEAKHLSSTAGSAFARSSVEPVSEAVGAGAQAQAPSRAKIAGALKRTNGNISAAARELGAHRTQLRRWMDRYRLDAADYEAATPPPGRDDDSDG